MLNRWYLIFTNKCSKNRAGHIGLYLHQTKGTTVSLKEMSGILNGISQLQVTLLLLDLLVSYFLSFLPY